MVRVWVCIYCGVAVFFCDERLSALAIALRRLNASVNVSAIYFLREYFVFYLHVSAICIVRRYHVLYFIFFCAICILCQSHLCVSVCDICRCDL